VPEGWDAVPGARGCTPQSCGFRDLHAELAATGARAVGLSTQNADEQRERIERLGLPFELVSDPQLRLRDELGLPTFELPGRGELYKRVTLVARGGVIERVFYPVFPPDRNAAEVLAYLTRSSA
jgi:peroxiredoxin